MSITVYKHINVLTYQRIKGFLRSQDLYLKIVNLYLRQSSLCSKSQNIIKVNLLGKYSIIWKLVVYIYLYTQFIKEIYHSTCYCGSVIQPPRFNTQIGHRLVSIGLPQVYRVACSPKVFNNSDRTDRQRLLLQDTLFLLSLLIAFILIDSGFLTD